MILSPLLTFAVQLAIFHEFFGTRFSDYSIFLLSGLMPWIFLSQTLDMCVGLLVNSTGLMRSLALNPLAYILAQGFDNLINFVAVLAVLLLPAIALGWVPVFAPVLLLLPILALSIAAISAAWLLSMLNVFYRDTRFLVSFGLGLGFFMTPIFYPVSRVKEQVLRNLIVYNPVHGLIRPFRVVMLEFTWLDYLISVGTAFAIAAGLAALAFRFWKRRKIALYLSL